MTARPGGIVLCGLDRLSFRTLQELLRLREDVVRLADALFVDEARALIVARIQVEAGSQADAQTVSGLEAGDECRVLLLIENGQRTWSPGPDTTLAAGHQLVVLATRAGLTSVTVTTRSERPATSTGS